MTTFTDITYKQLTDLVEKNESFHFKDFNLKDKIYRIFNYHLASWTSFSEPGALNCRGIMFDITNPEDVKLVSLPPEKFFNYEEGGVDHTKGKFGDKMDKMDGSLISTYMHDGEVYLKSKASLFSSQANDSMRVFNSVENEKFKEEITELVKQGYTVNLEYTAPTNRIVISYQEENLTVLSARSHETGENYFASKLIKLLDTKGNFSNIKLKLVKYDDLRNQDLTHDKFVEDIRNEQQGEGYVVEVIVDDDWSYLLKVKNLKYIALHHTKESVNSPRRLFETIINEASDDLRSLFADDEFVLNEINKMEEHVQPIYNNIIKTVESFAKENGHLSKKDYAIKANQENQKLSGLMINQYIFDKVASGEIILPPRKDGKVSVRTGNDYKEFAIKHRKEIFGIGEEEMELDENGNIVRNKPISAIL